MRAGERWDAGIDDVPLLAAASRRTRRRLAEHVERLRSPDGAVIAERGRPVHWIAFPLEGELAGADRSWCPGDVVFLGEGLLHGVAPETVVARGEVDVVHVPIRALTAALATDAALGLAVARALAGASAAMPVIRRRRGFEHRRLASVASVRPAA